MGPDFAFRGYTRRIARSVVDAMVPRWDEFDVELTDDTLDAVEATVRGYPPGVQAGVLAMLYAMEFGGPVLLTGVKPLSWHDREEVYRRLVRIGDHPVAPLRMIPLLWKIMVSFSAYSRPDVEAFLGLERRRWRDSRKAFRDALVQIDERNQGAPATPDPLIADDVIGADDYLRFDAESLLPATSPAATEPEEAGRA